MTQLLSEEIPGCVNLSKREVMFIELIYSIDLR